MQMNDRHGGWRASEKEGLEGHGRMDDGTKALKADDATREGGRRIFTCERSSANQGLTPPQNREMESDW